MTADGLAFRLGADVRCTVLEPHVERPYDPDDWRGALVLVQRGTLRVQCRSGHRAVFGRGSVLHLQDLTLRSISADGDDAAVLLAVLSARPGDSLHDPSGTQ